jgi:hypothetical protein
LWAVPVTRPAGGPADAEPVVGYLLAAVRARGPIFVDAWEGADRLRHRYRGGQITEETFEARVAAIDSPLQLTHVPAGECWSVRWGIGDNPVAIPAWARGSKQKSRYLAGWRRCCLCVDWPLVIACIVSPGAIVEGRWCPAGSVVIVDSMTIREPADVAVFAKRNRLAPFGFSAAPLAELVEGAHLLPVDLTETHWERARAMLGAAGTDTPALYVSQRCASLVLLAPDSALAACTVALPWVTHPPRSPVRPGLTRFHHHPFG